MDITPRNAESLVASTRSVKFLRNHVRTPKIMTMTHKAYQAPGYVAMMVANVGDVSCLSFEAIQVLFTIMAPLLH